MTDIIERYKGYTICGESIGTINEHWKIIRYDDLAVSGELYRIGFNFGDNLNCDKLELIKEFIDKRTGI